MTGGLLRMSSLTMQVTKRLETFLQGTKKLYIDGKFVPSASGATFDTPNPATGETLMTLYEATGCGCGQSG